MTSEPQSDDLLVPVCFVTSDVQFVNSTNILTPDD